MLADFEEIYMEQAKILTDKMGFELEKQG